MAISSILRARSGSRIFKREGGGGGGTNERLRRKLSRRVRGHAPLRNFLKFESLKWPFPAFRDKFRTRLILIFASKLRFCLKKISKRGEGWGGGGGRGPPGTLLGSATVTLHSFIFFFL